MFKVIRLAALLAALLVGGKANAALITGSQAFGTTVQGNNTDLLLCTQFSFPVSFTLSSSGDFALYPNLQPISSDPLLPPGIATDFATNVPVPFSFGSADFGTFVASTGHENPFSVDSVGKTRSFQWSGIFTKGTNAVWSPFDTLNSASAILSLTQSGDVGNVLSASWTMSTPDLAQIPGPATVPEPATLTIFGLGALGLIGLSRRRRA